MGTAKSLISVIWTGGLSIYNNSTNSLLLRDLYYILNKQVCIIIIAAANAASKRPSTAFGWVLNVYNISIVDWKKVFLVCWEDWPWSLTFEGHLKSKIFSPFETSYLTSIDTFSLSHTVFEIFDFKVFRVWPWPLEVTWGQKYFHH